MITFSIIMEIIDEEKLIKNLLNQKENIKTEIQELIVIAQTKLIHWKKLQRDIQKFKIF